MTGSLAVWWDRVRVGTLRPGRDADVNPMWFTYDDDWIADPASPPVSHCLPKDQRRFRTPYCRPFFDGLLPEGAQREAIAEALEIWPVWPTGALQLLPHMGAELAGALMVLPEGEAVPDRTANCSPAPLSDDGLAALLAAILERPFLVGTEDAPRLSLAGEEPKIPVVLADGQVSVPALGEPTTHILKPGSVSSSASAENEAFAMRLAARLGLGVAPVRLGSVNGRPYLLVRRFDRTPGPDGEIRRLHQEDFRQAFGMVPLPKTAWSGGPGHATCFELVRKCCTFPAAAVLDLLDAAIVQVILGNARAHARNYSLLWRRRGQIELAPLYGLVTTADRPHIPPDFTMKVAGRSTLEEMQAGDWDRFAAECGMSPSFVRRRVRELCGRTVECGTDVAAELAAPGLNEGALAGFAAQARDRALKLARTAR